MSDADACQCQQCQNEQRPTLNAKLVQDTVAKLIGLFEAFREHSNVALNSDAYDGLSADEVLYDFLHYAMTER